MGRSRRQGNCNTPTTCQVDQVAALDLLAGQTAQCDPQVLEPNPPALICDTPAGIQSLQGNNAEPIILTQLSELADAGQAILIKEPSGRIRALIPPNGVDFGVPVYQAGAVSVKDLAFALQNFNVSSIGDVGNCNFSMAVWSKCNDGSTIISLKQMSFADFVIQMGNALLTDSDFISKLDETVLSCTNTTQNATATSLFGCLNGAKSIFAAGSGPREIAGYNGVWNNVPRGFTLKIEFVQVLFVSAVGTYNVTMPAFPAALPNGSAWGLFQTIVNILENGKIVDVSTNSLRIGHLQSFSDAHNAEYQLGIAPCSSSQAFVVASPNGATNFQVTVNLIGYFS